MAANLTGFQLIHLDEGSSALLKIIIKMVDATDGFTEETGITFAVGDVKISKNGGAFANTTNLPTEVSGGFGSYVLTLGSTEVDTAGVVEIRATKAGSRNFYAFVNIVGFDILSGFATIGNVDGDVGGDVVGSIGSLAGVAQDQIGDACWDENADAHSVVDSFGERLGIGLTPTSNQVSDAGATATDFDTGLAEATDDFWNGALLVFVGGALAGQGRIINDYVGATKNVSFTNGFTAAPANFDNFVIVAAAGAGGGVALSDTLAELAQAKPAAVPTLEQCLMLLYMTARNKVETVAGEQKLHNDAGTVIAKSALSFAAGTFTRDELESGP